VGKEQEDHRRGKSRPVGIEGNALRVDSGDPEIERLHMFSIGISIQRRIYKIWAKTIFRGVVNR